jgi:hypothetical protein
MGIDETRQEDALPQILADPDGVPADEIVPGSHVEDLTSTDRHSPVSDRRPAHRHNGPGTEQSGIFRGGHGKVLTQILQRNHDNRSGAFTKRVTRIRVKNNQELRKSGKDRDRDDL